MLADRLLVLFAISLAPFALPGRARAAATTVVLTQQGHLLESGDRPVDNTATSLAFQLFTTLSHQENEVALWESGPCAVNVAKGFYSVLLGAGAGVAGGCGTNLPAAALPPGTPRFLEISVDSVTLAPRMRLSDVPTAVTASLAQEATHALTADLSTTSLDAQQLKSDLASATGAVNTSGLVHWHQLAGVPAPFADGSDDGASYQADGTTLSLVGSVFGVKSGGIGSVQLDSDANSLARVSAGALSQANGDVSSTGSITVSGTGKKFVGDGSGLTQLQTSALLGPIGDAQATSLDVAKLSSAQTLTGLKTFNPSGTVPFAVATGKTATVSNLSAEMFAGQKLFALPFSCPSGQFVSGFTSTGGMLTPTCTAGMGSLGAAGNPGVSCAAIRTARATEILQDGIYSVDPDGAIGVVVPFDVWCDMNLDAGGWTLWASVVKGPSALTGTVQPSSSGYMDATRYATLYPAATKFRVRGQTTGVRFFVSKSELAGAGCSNLSSPVPENVDSGMYTTVYGHTETSGCTLSGGDYAWLSVNTGTTLGAVLTVGQSTPRLWHKDSESGSQVDSTSSEAKVELYLK